MLDGNRPHGRGCRDADGGRSDAVVDRRSLSLRWALASGVLALAVLELLVPSPSWAAPRVANVSIALVDASQTGTVVSGSVAPGSVVRVKVTATVSTGGDRWRSTGLSLNGATATCLDTGDHNNAGTFSEVLGRT